MRKKTPNLRLALETGSRKDGLGGEANYPGKEQGKNDPGNRYTAAR